MTAAFSETPLQLRFKTRSRYLMAGVVLIALAGLAGWEFDVVWLRHPLPSLISMNPLSATSFLAAGISFFIFHSDRETKAFKTVAFLLAAVPVLIGLISGIEIITDQNLMIDRLLYYE